MNGVNIPRDSYLRWVIDTLAIAALYYFTGKLGQLMAIPPSNITLVWPPSGISLGLILLLGPRAIPGIFLGAILVMAPFYFDSSDISTLISSSFIGLSIGLGSTLQPVVGRYLMQRYDCAENPFEDLVTTFKFFIIATAMCLISSSIGSLSLCISGFSQWQDVVPIWSGWWFGDSIGVLIFTPLIVTISQQSVTKIAILICILITGMSATYISSVTTRTQTEEAWYGQAKIETNRLTKTFDLWLTRTNIALVSLATLIKGSEEITKEEFDIAIQSQASYDPDFFPHAIAYAIFNKQEQNDELTWSIILSTEEDGVLSIGSDILMLPGAGESISYALNNPDSVTALPKIELTSGKYYVPNVLAVKHKNETGMLIGLMNLSNLITGLEKLVIPEGLGLRATAYHLNGSVFTNRFFLKKAIPLKKS